MTKSVFAVLICIAALAAPPPPPLYGSDWALSGIATGGHNGSITALVHNGDTVLSAGEDGFLEIWNAGNQPGNKVAERFQVSSYRIIAMAGRPGKNEVCLIENDSMGQYRISAWNYTERRNIFTLPLGNPFGYIAYSMAGNFIIAARTGRAGLVFYNADSGNVMPSPPSLNGTVRLAVTGRSERNMLVYSESGELTYWDLASGNETAHFEVPSNLSSPVLFSNSRYLAGINAEGLAVINAVSGELLARDASIPDGSLLCSAGDELICIIQRRNEAVQLYRYTIDRAGQLITPGRYSLPGNSRGDNYSFTVITAYAGVTNALALGTTAGSLVLSNINGRLSIPVTREKINIIEAEVSGQIVAFLTGNMTMGFIPLQYNQLTQGSTIRIEQNPEAYNRITVYAGTQNSEGQFVLWQDNNIRTRPVLWRSATRGEKQPLGDISLRSPVRSMDSLGGKILLLDSTGNITVVSPFDTEKTRPFTFFSVGLMDAAFVDSSRIIIGRSAVSGNTPFMMINIDTGETVPLPYSSQAGVTLHRGASGSMYAATVSSDTRTAILQLNLTNIADSGTIYDFQGEETQFSLAESPGGTGGSLAAIMGGEEAAIYSSDGIQRLDRTSGYPLKLIEGGSFLISLDRDGSICWHDSRDGKLLAIFKLNLGGWMLQTEQRTINGRFSS